MSAIFTCDECGKDFPADPETMVEEGVSAHHDIVPGEEWKHDGHTPELSPEDREKVKGELGVSDEELDRILSGEMVTIGGICICKPCQDQMLESQESEE